MSHTPQPEDCLNVICLIPQLRKEGYGIVCSKIVMSFILADQLLLKYVVVYVSRTSVLAMQHDSEVLLLIVGSTVSTTPTVSLTVTTSTTTGSISTVTTTTATTTTTAAAAAATTTTTTVTTAATTTTTITTTTTTTTTTTPTSTATTTVTAVITTTTPTIDEKNGAGIFLRGRHNYSTLQPSTKRSVSTETDAAELDHYSDDEAPLATARGCGGIWVSLILLLVTRFSGFTN